MTQILKPTEDCLITAGMLADRLRPLVLAACDGEPPERFGSSCLNGTPMIPLHRATVTAVYAHLERLAALDGETTDRAREYPKSHDVRSQNIPVLASDPDELREALEAVVALHDDFMTTNDGFMGNQADAYYCIAKQFDVWKRARTALSRNVGDVG